MDATGLSLTTSLALLGGVVLLALVLQGWWATRRAQARKAGQEPAPLPTAGGRVEPALGGGAADAAADAGAGAGADDFPTVLRTLPRRTPRLDALIDALVPLALDAPVTGDAVLAHLPPTRRAGAKPFYVEGLDTETGDWDVPAPGRRYGELQAGVQLANRSGALNEIEYSEFVQKVQAFAETLGAAPDFPDMREVVARARELDGLTSGLDAQLTLTLRANSVAWSVGYIQQCAARHGFMAGAVPGRLVVPAAEEGAPPMLLISIDSQAAMAALDSEPPQAGAVREFTLTLDVPQTDAAAEPFPAWHRAATALADDMDATLVDDQGQPVVLAAFAAIGQELEQLYARLQQLDLAAGSAAARRLFS